MLKLLFLPEKLVVGKWIPFGLVGGAPMPPRSDGGLCPRVESINSLGWLTDFSASAFIIIVVAPTGLSICMVLVCWLRLGVPV